MCRLRSHLPLPPSHRKRRRRRRERPTEAEPSSPQPIITKEGRRESERVVLSLSASRPTLLRRLNSHFLYKIDALTAALVHTWPHTVTPEFSSGCVQPRPSSAPLLASRPSIPSPLLLPSSPWLMSLPVCRTAIYRAAAVTNLQKK